MSTHNKKHPQLERIILFTDAVFAIAITLLAIEIKIPELHEVNEHTALVALNHLIPRFVGFIISFLVIGIYWIAHHKIFSYVIDFDRKLLWLNLILLMFIVLLPFSTGYYSEYVSLKLPFLIYGLNIFLVGLLQARIVNYVAKNELSHGLTLWLRRYIIFRGLVPGIVFLLVALLQYILPGNGSSLIRIGMGFIALPFYFLKKYFAKKGVDVKNY